MDKKKHRGHCKSPKLLKPVKLTGISTTNPVVTIINESGHKFQNRTVKVCDSHILNVPNRGLTVILNLTCIVRILKTDDGEIWFVAKDVCKALGLTNVRDALVGLDDDERITLANPEGNPRAGIPHTYNLINESGLYSLVLRSRKPEAKNVLIEKSETLYDILKKPLPPGGVRRCPTGARRRRQVNDRHGGSYQ